MKTVSVAAPTDVTSTPDSIETPFKYHPVQYSTLSYAECYIVAVILFIIRRINKVTHYFNS